MYEGSVDTNIIYQGKGQYVLKEAGADLARRYKMVYSTADEGVQHPMVQYSPDGLRWEPAPGLYDHNRGDENLTILHDPVQSQVRGLLPPGLSASHARPHDLHTSACCPTSVRAGLGNSPSSAPAVASTPSSSPDFPTTSRSSSVSWTSAARRRRPRAHRGKDQTRCRRPGSGPGVGRARLRARLATDGHGEREAPCPGGGRQADQAGHSVIQHRSPSP